MPLWDEKRVERYFQLYGDPRAKTGSQSNLCGDASDALEGDSVIDFGHGMGHIIPYLGDKGYLGLDSSEDMSKTASTLFPGKEFMLVDITKPGLREALGVDALKGAGFMFGSAVCVSVFIHLSREEMKATLKNMASVSKCLVFSMETNGDNEKIRPDGLRIRNESVENVLNDLKELGKHEVTWAHQSFTFSMIQTILPRKDLPLKSSQELIARTTIFKVVLP
jgi:SAM-dependent methyltransferase